MKHIATFGRFWYDFIIGDDWRVALGATVAIALVYVAAHNGANFWWLLPVAVGTLLAVSVNHATRGKP